MSRLRTHEDIAILTAQLKNKIDRAEYCLSNIDTAAAGIEVFIGNEKKPYTFYMTSAELTEFLKKEIETQKAQMKHIRQYYKVMKGTKTA